jgi:large repetitive protein
MAKSHRPDKVSSQYSSDTDSRVDVGPEYYTLSTTGTCQVVIDDANNATGNYKFRLLDGATLPSLALDTEVSGIIDQGGVGTIGYGFSATAGQHLYLDTGAGAAGNSWSLHSVNGQQIGFGYIQDGSGGDQEFDIGVTGEYLLFIRGNGAANTNYRLRLTDAQPVRSALAFAERSGTEIGNRIDGSIAKPGQSHTYIFSGTVGQQLHLDVLSRGNPGTNVARIYDQRGTEVYSRSLYDLDANDLLVLKESGNYRLVIDGNGATTDAYAFRLLDAKAGAATIGLDSDVSGQLVRKPSSIGSMVPRGKKSFLTGRAVLLILNGVCMIILATG